MKLLAATAIQVFAGFQLAFIEQRQMTNNKVRKRYFVLKNLLLLLVFRQIHCLKSYAI